MKSVTGEDALQGRSLTRSIIESVVRPGDPQAYPRDLLVSDGVLLINGLRLEEWDLTKVGGAIVIEKERMR